MKKVLSQFFSEDNGNKSSMRLLVAAVVLIPLITWSVMCIKTGQMISWDLPDIGLIATALGMKAYQKGKENVSK